MKLRSYRPKCGHHHGPADQTKGHEVVQVMNRSIPSGPALAEELGCGLPIIPVSQTLAPMCFDRGFRLCTPGGAS